MSSRQAQESALIVVAACISLSAVGALYWSQEAVPLIAALEWADCRDGFGALVRTGKRFRASLTAADVATIKSARNYFIASQLIPELLYFVLDAAPKFPCSISFSIRRGLPRWTQHAGWLYGWYLMSSVLWHAGGPFLSFFGVTMFVTGFVGVCVFRLGDGSTFTSAIHSYSAGLYMLDHVVLVEILGITAWYRRAFVGAMLITFATYAWKVRLERTNGIHGEVDDGGKAQLRELWRRAPSNARLLWWVELCFMVCENVLFLAFVGGMASGLRRT